MPDTIQHSSSPLGVTLVIPGRNSAKTIGPCLSAVVPMLNGPVLKEILFVDDGSTDETRSIASGFPVTVLESGGRGPGAARNAGWRAAKHPLVWFVDSDCVAEPDALSKLHPLLTDPQVGGASGSYGIMNPQSLLASLIHEEIIERHLAMPRNVNFLATFNVLYRRDVLEKVDGLDERFLKAQDAELSFRVMAAGYHLHFTAESRVKHFHETAFLKYLRTQRHQGYWRVWLHMAHRGHSTGDSYSSLVDHAQPPMATLVLASIPLLWFDLLRFIPLALIGFLFVAQLPMTAKICFRTRKPKYILFGGMSWVRAFWRGIGMLQGMFGYLTSANSKERR